MKYNILIRVLHWVVAIIVIGLLLTVENRGMLPPELKKNYFYWHKSFGALVLLLMLTRYFFRQVTTVPPYPDSMKKIEKLAAKIAVYAFYALLVLMPLSGWIMSNAAGYPVSMFGIELPTLLEKNKQIKNLANEAHELIGNGIIILIILHVLAVVKHAVVEKTNLMKRMW